MDFEDEILLRREFVIPHTPFSLTFAQPFIKGKKEEKKKEKLTGGEREEKEN